jgi:hypothetical protein
VVLEEEKEQVVEQVLVDKVVLRVYMVKEGKVV